MEDTNEIEDIYEIDDTDECGLRFSDAKYYDGPALGKDNYLNEDSERELREKLEDPMIKPREADKPPDEEFPPADKINDDVYTSEWYYALKGKEVRSLTYEDLKDITFRNVKEGEKFYGYYCFVVGFSKRVYKNDKVTINGVEHVSRKVWCCSKEGCEKSAANGKQDVVHNTETSTEEEHASEDETCLKKRKKTKNAVRGLKYSRTGCEALFVLRLDKKTMLYTVRKFVTEHNHGLAEPVERQFLSCFREVTEDDISVVLSLRTAHVPTSVAYEFLALQAGGPQFVGFMLKDLYNKLDEVRKHNNDKGDAQAAINWLRMKGHEEESFFGRYTPDGEGRLANLFWRDTESLLDYNAFGDVVIIDSTYKTNIYCCPVILFVGSNNHRGSVLFACAIVANEKEETFTWVIQKFLESMNNKHPKTVVTDGDEVMRTVLNKLLPTTRHRLCAWHIGRNIGQNVKDAEVQKELGKMIYASYTIDEWEDAWDNMVDKFGLENNIWITALYEKRDRWAEAFFRGQFCAGMCSTQRCEGYNGKIKTRIGRFTVLSDFLPRFDSGVGYLRNRVLLDIYKSKNQKRKYDSHLKRVEEDVFNIFTDDIFVVIKGQILLEARFSVTSRIQFGGSEDLMFYLSQYERPNRSWTVLYRPVDGVYSCSCLQYESDGILCPHIFSVLKYQNVSVYPKSMILDRWTKGGGRLKVDHTAAKSGDNMSGRLLRYSALMAEAKKACHNLSYSAEGFDTGMVQLCGLVESSKNYRASKKPRVADQEPDNGMCNVLKDPVIARTKGMHGNNVAAAVNGNVGEGNKCGKCGIPGHNIRRCPLLVVETDLAGKSVKSGRSAQSGRCDKSTKADKSGDAKQSDKSAKAGR
uniref:protein FAR1-RELATED SEQUENCE 5-like n=1 Tax=Fragaria vesca subsp. vesca TaxID=101020 RepID=UPI0005C9C2AD|nr:PREDICTED: protein FAR1-RELATED SEQUENCE 5-like [Fragaria vesca subsp. vesca]